MVTGCFCSRGLDIKWTRNARSTCSAQTAFFFFTSFLFQQFFFFFLRFPISADFFLYFYAYLFQQLMVRSFMQMPVVSYFHFLFPFFFISFYLYLFFFLNSFYLSLEYIKRHICRRVSKGHLVALCLKKCHKSE